MTKPQYFRIGNYVYCNDRLPIIIREIKRESILYLYKGKNWYNLEFKYLEPIPLTEEILLKCGFEKLEETILTGLGRSETTYEKDNFRFYLLKPEKYNAFVFCLGNDVINDKIEYLHQLQNLYFALTNEELTIQL